MIHARMEEVAHFTIESEPVSKERPRVTGGHAYTPQKTRAAEAVVAWAFRKAVGAWQPDDTSRFSVEMIFFNGNNRRRDLDNMVKLILDSLNKLCWADDHQVDEITARKYAHSVTPSTEIRIHRHKGDTQ